MIDYNRSFCDALTNLYRAMYHLADNKSEFYSSVTSIAANFLNNIPGLGDCTRSLWIDELTQPLNHAVDLYNPEMVISDDILNERNNVLSILCEYLDTLTDDDYLTILKVRYFMSYVCELTHRATDKLPLTNFLMKGNKMTNSEKCLTLIQTMTNIAGATLSGAESIVLNTYIQAGNKDCKHKLDNFDEKRDKAKNLFREQFKNWLAAIGDYKVEDPESYDCIKYSVLSLIDTISVYSNRLFSSRGLTAMQRTSVSSFIQKMIEIVQETYENRLKDCELLKDTDSHFENIRTLLYMIMKYTVDRLTDLKGVLADDNAVTETTFFSRED